MSRKSSSGLCEDNYQDDSRGLITSLDKKVIGLHFIEFTDEMISLYLCIKNCNMFDKRI